MIAKARGPRNRTLTCTTTELARLSDGLTRITGLASAVDLRDTVIHQDLWQALPFLPDTFADLLILDPPYNLTKDFNGHVFTAREPIEY
ncbi:MAG TPA: hypothetical protein VK324_10025 [Tepidisphaeraceae bacterium]|nr:hypothetical protein [Tepidisphaeraceae bacterium]